MPKCLRAYADKKKALRYRNKSRLANYARGNVNSNRRFKRYSRIEKICIRDRVFSDRTLALLLERSVQAIQLQRCKIRHGKFKF